MFADAELAQIAEVASRAAELAARLQSSARGTEKADGTLVTDADVAVEEFLREGLQAAFGAVSVVGEEEGGEASDALVFVIDPIDGTLSYARGSPLWAVSVGVLEGGRPLAGAVAAPGVGALWTGAQGCGAWRNGRRISARAVRLDRHALISVTSEALRRYGPAPPELGHMRCLGGISLQIAMCADGTIDAAVVTSWKPWDIAGAAAVLLAAGGRLLSAASGLDASELPTTDGGADLVAGGPGLERLVPVPIPRWAQAG